MRSFFHKYFDYKHRYPIKVWSAAVIDEIPYSVSFDGATLRQINLFTKKVVHSKDYHHLNAFSICIYMPTNIYKFENLFLLVKNQRNIEIYDGSLNHIHQFDFDTGSAIIALHWHKPTNRLFTCGTNGWLRCFYLTTQHKVTEFVAEWSLVWEIRSTPEWIMSLAHDDFTQLLYGVVEDSLFAWDLNTGDFKYRLPQMHNNFKLCHVDVDPESSVVITSGLDGYIRTWDIKELECKNLQSFEVGPKGYTSFIRCGRQIVTIGCDRIVKYYGISDASLRCQIPLADPTQKHNPDEVVKPQLVVLETEKGYICITSYKERLQSALLGFAPEEFLSTDSTITSMAFDKKEKKLLSMCKNNFVLASGERGISTTIDMDIPHSNKCKRCCVSEVNSFCMNDDVLYVGFKNGSLKCINIRKMECILLADVSLEESIDYVTIVKGLFVFNHPTCGDLNQFKTDKNHPFIVCYTSKGIISVWCAKCYTHLLFSEIGKKPVTCMKIIPEKSLLIISAQKTLTFFRIDAYNFNPLGEITTSGNQSISSFAITEEMDLIAGTSSGEIMILSVEEGEKEFHFHLKHHIALQSPVFKVHYSKKVGKPVISLKNGTLMGINQKTAKLINQTNHADAEPLTAVYFRYNPGDVEKIGAYLAFGTRIHYAVVNTYEEPVVEVEEEEEEEEQKVVVQNDDNDEKEENIIKYFEDAQSNISRLMYLCQRNELQKKRAQYIPEMGTTAPPKTPKLPPQKRKPTYAEVMAKNRSAAQDALGNFGGSVSKTSTRSYKIPTGNGNEEDVNENELNLMITPFFYTDLPENSRFMVPPLKKPSTPNSQTRLNNSMVSTQSVSVTEKNLLYNEGNTDKFEAIIDENDEIERTTPLYIPPGGRYVLSKLKTENVKAPTIIHKVFVGPPSAPRILFNDPTTLNGLSFFDPRGFQSRLDGEGDEEYEFMSEQGPTSENSLVNSEANNEEEEDVTEETIELIKKPKTELERRKVLKRNRIPISMQMKATVTIRPKTTQANRKPFITSAQQNDINNDSKSPQTNRFQPRPKTPQQGNQQKAQTQRIRTIREPLNTQPPKEGKKPPIIITNVKQTPPSLPHHKEYHMYQNSQNNQPQHEKTPIVTPIQTSKAVSDDSLMSPKKVQFFMPDNKLSTSKESLLSQGQNTSSNASPRASSTGSHSPHESGNSSSRNDEVESTTELPLINIKLRRDPQERRRRKIKNQPIHLNLEKESSLHEFTKIKLPEPEKYTKQKPQNLHPRMKDENAAVKAAMSSPKPGPVINKKQSPKFKKKKKMSRSTTSSSAISEMSSFVGDSENEQKNIQEDIIELPETVVTQISEEALRDQEQARINQLRRQKFDSEDLFGNFFTSESGKSSDKYDSSMPEGENRGPHFKRLHNLAKYFEQKMIFPVIPFECGNPSTASVDAPPLFDDALNSFCPIDPPHQFSGSTADKGIDELLRRFNKFLAFNMGESNEKIDEIYETSKNDDILSNLPSMKRRLSF
ncbi:hypothetical protein TRFO_21192 [Tritrichomonas foetus]|uniref:Uncharacterized protein n=1 Tax=Tritrichomonas foetus TaxID=1144522 RepID=A0A1J4KFR1_9EUKA|nr:hypothetical protein TRFO_21192 [Tritrichomonas foetus]|eukprot:OHT09768.1 hypothetical protein TRFO_21192 [Tritrichomonas foetus]